RRPAPRDGGEAALAAVVELLAELRAVDPFVRLEAENALHRMRTLCRRLRSVLAASRSVLDRSATDPIRDELRWLGGVLGAARDEEVLGARLRAGLAAAAEQLPAAAVPESSLLVDIEGRHGVALRRVARTLRGGRYLDLLASLDELIGDPPRTAKAGSSARKLVKRSLKKELSRLETARSGPDRHEVRKAAKRLRYVAEAWRSVVPSAVGSRAHRLGSTAEDIADALGEQRDALAARRALGEHSARAARLGEPAAALGVAFAEEGHRARDAQRAADDAFARFDSLSS
ncbi:CHAD domain-containing protein, partial [Rathayibacter sp. ZW T2_19]